MSEPRAAKTRSRLPEQGEAQARSVRLRVRAAADARTVFYGTSRNEAADGSRFVAVDTCSNVLR